MKNRLVFLPAAVIVLALLLVGTFFDLSISQNIVQINNLFSKVFAIFASLPATIASGVIVGFLIQLLIHQYSKIWSKILLALFALICLLLSVFIFGEAITSYHSFDLPRAYFALGFVVTIPSAVLGYFLYRFTDNKTLLRNVIFLVVVLVIVSGSVEVIKHLVPRVRFTAVSQMPGGLDFYRPWYLSNLTNEQVAQVKEWVASHPTLGGEEHESFPSGHSAIALATILILIYLPRIFPRTRLLKYQWILFYCGFLHLLIVAFSRIYGGAHYLSDTMFSAFLGLIVYFIANEIYIRKIIREAKV